MKNSAAKILVDSLITHSVDRVFCVPGESYLSIVDALYDNPAFELVPCRHEGSAAFMAMADAKITGRPGICFASRGPGATNAAIALHAAQQDGQPLILFLGQVQRDKLGKRALQEIAFDHVFSDICKSIEEIYQPERLSEAVARAFQKALTGTPGPVIVSMPADMLEELTEATVAQPRRIAIPSANASQIDELSYHLVAAQRPILIAGTHARSGNAKKALQTVSESWQIPVMTAFENQDIFDNEDLNYVGLLGLRPPPELIETVKESDLIVAIGTTLDDVTTQGFSLPYPSQKLIHVFQDSDQIGHVSNPAQVIASDAESLLQTLATRNPPPAAAGDRSSWIEECRQRYLTSAELRPRDADDGIDFGHVMAALTKFLPDDAIITSDAGSFASWLHRHFKFRKNQLMLGATSGAMGFGVPAAIAASLRYPDRAIIALVGDGGMMMTGSELATAMQQNTNITIIVSNNNAYGTIRFHQEKRYPGRNMGTDLVNPDFAVLAKAYGARGYMVNTPENCDQTIYEALHHEGTAIIDVSSSLENITAATTISSLRKD